MPGRRQPGVLPRWRALTPRVRDGVLAAGFVTVMQAELVVGSADLEGPRLAQHAVLAVIGLAVAVRRSQPLLAATVVGAAMAVTGALGAAPSAAVFVVYLLVTYSIAWYARSRRVAIVGLVALVLPDGIVYPLTHPEGRNVAEVVINAGIPITLWLLARLGREQLERAVAAEREVAQQRLAALQEQSRRAEATAHERRRIARECHDVIGHGITLMLVYAEAAQARLGGREPAVSEALDVVTATGRAALVDVRQVLEVLRAEGDADASPGGLGDVDGLVERVRGTGTRVEWEAVAVPTVVPATVSTTAYRVVQEALTNVLRHAPGAQVNVRLRGDRDGVHVEVVDDGSSTGSARTPSAAGLGLAGIRERVALLGGELRAGPREDRSGWQVSATLPVRSGRP